MAICSKCGNSMKDGLKFCPNCGVAVGASPAEQADPVFASAGITVGGAQQYQAQPPQYQTPQPQYQAPSQSAPPPQYRQPYYGDTEGTGCYEVYPAWKYMGLMLLQTVPLLGFILTIVFAFNNNNLNRRNFCRGILLVWAISIALSILLTVFFGATIAALVSSMDLSELEAMQYYF